MTTFKKIIIPVLGAIVLSGCFGEPAPVPQDYFYTLPELNAEKQENKFDTLYVDTIRATGVYNERAILYIDYSSPLSIKRYHYHHWVMPPAQLVHQRIKQYFSGSKLANSVLTYRPSLRKGAIIKGNLLQFEQVINGSNTSTRVAMELEFVSDKKHFAKRYSSSVTARNKSFDASAEAFGKAIESILKQFSSDIT